MIISLIILKFTQIGVFMKKGLFFLAGLVFSGSIATASTIVSVNGMAITDKDINPLLLQVTQGRYNSLPEETQKQVRQKAIEQSIAQKLVVIEAKKDNLDKSAEFKNDLDEAFERVKEQLLADRWLKLELERITISDKEIKDYYNNNKEQFNEEESVHARHILVKTEAEAKDLIKDLNAYSGEKLKEMFINYAKAKSTGPSGKNGGDLGFFKQGQMVPEFNKAVFSMKVGTVSDVVKTQFGYHVIYLEEKRDARKVPFDMVKEPISQQIKVEKFKTYLKDKMDKLKDKAEIKFN